MHKLTLRAKRWVEELPDDVRHDVQLMLAIMIITSGLAGIAIICMTIALLVSNTWWLEGFFLVLSLAFWLSLIAFIFMRLWIDWGRPLKRWVQRKRGSKVEETS